MPNESLRVPCFCPVCKSLMKGRSTFTYYDYGCCIDCYIWFIEGRSPETVQKWRDGWRPGEEELERYRQMMKN